MSRARLEGAFLFLFIPLVLVLYLRMPLGPAPSLALGVALMIGHRFLAQPFMSRHLGTRCFWCGADLSGAWIDAAFDSSGLTVAARACSEAHGESLTAFARVVSRGRALLRALIVLPVLAYLTIRVLEIARLTPVSHAAAVWLFKIPIAVAVVALSFLWPRGRALDAPPAIDFPVHNLFLLGIRNTLWVFRAVGLVWLLQAAWAARVL